MFRKTLLIILLIGLTALQAQPAPLVLERVTAYNAVAAQTNSQPELSSCGPTLPNQIAVSRDLFFQDGVKHLCGREATIVTDDGQEFTGIINDTMNPRYVRSADILFASYAEAREFGVQSGELVIH